MNHLSLFSGIGGFDLAARWMGWENVAHVEKNPFCRKILKQHFPKSKSYEDIKEFKGQEYRGKIDIISGGFPCQPFSVAGKQGSKNDDRYLWPEMLRVIQEIRPSWVVAENVTGIIKLALNDVLSSLESEGYKTQSFVIPACSIGTAHRRDRVWIVAHTSEKQLQRSTKKQILQERRIQVKLSRGSQAIRISSNPTEPPICGVTNGFPGRVDRIKALGNAIVPQVAYQIFKAIDSL